MFTCGALGCLPTVFRPRGAVFTCGADIYLRCFGMFTSGGAEIFMPDGMGCIPPVVSPTLGGSKFEYTSGGSCGRACNIRPRIGTFTCGATWTTTCGAIASTAGVHLSLPPVAPADVPAIPAQELGHLPPVGLNFGISLFFCNFAAEL